jgi:hypothetical protein
MVCACSCSGNSGSYVFTVCCNYNNIDQDFCRLLKKYNTFMSPILSTQQIRALRLEAQGLARDPREGVRSAAGVVRRVVGAQAQELPAALLSIRARSRGITAAQVEDDRQSAALAWTWAMRGTLHLLEADDARWLAPLLGPGFAAGNRRRMAQLGWDEDTTRRGLRLLYDTVSRQGPMTRPEIARLLEEHELPHEGQAPIHLIARAAQEGKLVRGPRRGDETAFALFEDWLGPLQPLPRAEALERLALRYLGGYGPAAPVDLAAWAGIKAADARAAWQEIADRVTAFEAPGGTLWLLNEQLPWLEAPQGEPVARLLPRFDTYLLGYAERDLGVGKAEMKRIYPGGGIIHPVLLVDGRALGTWRLKKGKTLAVQVEPFAPLGVDLLPALEAEAADVGRFLGHEARLLVVGT